MPDTLAWRTNSGAGGNTRLSVNTDSIVDDDIWVLLLTLARASC